MNMDNSGRKRTADVARITAGESRPPLRICYFGAYDPNYTRVRMVIRGLRDNGVEVVECCARDSNRPLRFLRLVKEFMVRGWMTDLILVSEHGQVYTPLAKVLGVLTNKPVILDAFLSHYQIAVLERRTVASRSLRAKLLYLIDYLSCRMADKVLLDTPEHIDYFCKEFRLDRQRFEAVPIGADDAWFRPSIGGTEEEDPRPGVLRVLWIGTYYPLQGLEHVLRAAYLLREERDVRFEFYGDGPLRDQILNEAKRLDLQNVVFHGWIEPDAVPTVLRGATLCLGQFGATLQASIVVPCKVYEALAMARPLLTASTPAIRRYLRHREHAYLCAPGDPKAIADAILELKHDPKLRHNIAEQGLELFRRTGSRATVGAQVRSVCEEAVRQRRRGAR